MYSFTPLPGYFSPFPHGTCPLSVTREYSGLAGGPAGFTPNFTGSVLLGKHAREVRRFRVRGSHPLRRPLPEAFHYRPPFLTPRSPGRGNRAVPRPRPHNACRLSHAIGLASSAFARHYSRNHCCFLFLWVLRCFTSPRSLRTPYVFRRGSHHMTGAGFPHSDILGSTLGWQLPEAYRSLLRPSSAPGAQASTVCP